MIFSKKVPVLYVNGEKFDKELILSVELAKGYVKVEVFNTETEHNDIYTFSYDEVEIKMEPRVVDNEEFVSSMYNSINNTVSDIRPKEGSSNG